MVDNRAIRVFLSYHREDNTDAFQGVVDQFFKELNGQLKAEVSVEVRVFRDVEAMVGGEDWRRRISETIADTSIFIPIVTTRWFHSSVCMQELNAFRTNTPLDELQTAVLPLVLAGHQFLTSTSDQEEVRFIESLHWRDMRQPYMQGSTSREWRQLVYDVVNDILTWHHGYSERHRFIAGQIEEKTGTTPAKFVLDNAFLDDLGLSLLSDELKQTFLQEIYTELEIRVGEKLTEGMSNELLDEFGYFVDMDEPGMRSWLADNIPDFANSEAYRALSEANPNAPKTALMSEYGAMMWLSINRPDYPVVVEATLEELKEEIRENKDAIIDGSSDWEIDTED